MSARASRRHLLRLGTAALGLSLLAASAAGAQDAARSVELRVEGMHCGACAERLEDVLGRLDGVVSAEVDYDAGRASITFVPARVSVARIIGAIEDAGFRATPVS